MLLHPLTGVTCVNILFVDLFCPVLDPKQRSMTRHFILAGSVVPSFKRVCGFAVDVRFFSAVRLVLGLTETSEMWGRHWGRVLMPWDHCSTGSSEKGRPWVEHFKRLWTSVSGTGGPNCTVVTVPRPLAFVHWKNSRRCTARTNPCAITAYRNLISKSPQRNILHTTIYAVSHSLMTNNSRFSKNLEHEETEPENTTGSQLLF